MPLVPVVDHGRIVFAKIDEEDAHLCQYKWHSRGGYARRNRSFEEMRATGQGQGVTMHREIMGHPAPPLVIHHKNGDTLDNRRCNLEVVTNKRNCETMPGSTRSHAKIRGVCYYKKLKKYGAQVRHFGKLIHIGVFTTAEEAASAAAAKRKELGFLELVPT